MPQTSTCLWFEQQAEDAAQHDLSDFPNSRVSALTHDGPGAPLPEGTVLTVTFELDGRTCTALDGGPAFTLAPAASKDEVDHDWNALSADRAAGQCGWQTVPAQLFDMRQDPDAARRRRVRGAPMEMKKLELAALQRAFNA